MMHVLSIKNRCQQLEYPYLCNQEKCNEEQWLPKMKLQRSAREQANVQYQMKGINALHQSAPTAGMQPRDQMEVRDDDVEKLQEI
jgi:hypothetical protein